MMKKETIWTKDFLCVSFSSFFMFMTFYMLMSALPIYIVDVLHGKESQIGLVTTLFLVSSIISRPFIGKWVDEFGRRKLLYISLFIFTVASTLYIGIHSLFVLLILRFFHGFGFGMSTTVLGTVAADLIPARRRGEGISYFGMFMNLAMVIGPFIGILIISKYDSTVFFIACACCSAIAFLFSSRIKVPHIQVMKKQGEKRKFRWSDILETSALRIAIITGVLSFAYSGIISFISVYAKEVGSVDDASYFFAIYAFMLVVARPFAGRLFDSKGAPFIMYPGIGLYMIGMVLLSFANSTPLFLLSGGIIGLGYGALVPCLQTLIVGPAAEHRRGVATSTFYAFYDIGVAIGSLLLGYVSMYTNYQTMYLVSVIFIVIAAFLFHVEQREVRIVHEETKRLSG
jgi:MFS family permease